MVKEAKFGGKYIQVYRGLKEEEWIFDDEANVKKFLSLTEFNKEVSGMSYAVKQNSLSQALHDVWGVNTNFEEEYWRDYSMLKDDESERSSWCDKYMTVVFRKGDASSGSQQHRIHRQPLPDFMRWLDSNGELHYLPYEQRLCFPNGPWDSVPGCYLPSHILDLAYVLMPKPARAVLRSLALLCWLPEHEVLQFFEEKDKDEKEDINDGKKKETLVTMCKDLKIESSGKKPEIVERLALVQKDDAPCPPKLYDGKKLPKSTNEIGQLSLCYLQSILKYHGFATCGTKDELILRISLISNKRKYLCFNRERKMFLDLISMTKDLILEERKQALLSENFPRYRHRTHSTPMAPSLSADRPRQNASAQTQHTTKANVLVPPKVAMENVHEIFEALVQLVSREKKTDQKSAENENLKKSTSESTSVVDEEMTNCTSVADILQVERKVNSIRISIRFILKRQ